MISKLVSVSLCITKHYAMKIIKRLRICVHVFLTLAIVVAECSDPSPCGFILEERAPPTHLVGGLEDHRIDLDDMEK
jgi:hypothetical protein